MKTLASDIKMRLACFNNSLFDHLLNDLVLKFKSGVFRTPTLELLTENT
jgi:hypothetical protein